MTDATPQPEGSGGFTPLDASQPGFNCILGGALPRRVPNFIGRKTVLDALHAELGRDNSPAAGRAPSVLWGLDGVGKSQVAAEYVHQHQSEYQVAWWVRARDEKSIVNSLLGLGRQLGLADFDPEDRERSLFAISAALQSDERYRYWLLVFDDVTDPAVLRKILDKYIPQSTGHKIVTSYIKEWREVLGTDGIEVKVLTRPDTIEFLRARVAELAPGADNDAERESYQRAEADRLADAVGDLPLVAEYAASLIAMSGQSVSEYIEAFDHDPKALLSQDVDSYAGSRVAKTWNVAVSHLSEDAIGLFRLLTFFAAAPIRKEVLLWRDSGPWNPALPQSLPGVLASREKFLKAMRDLLRLSLISQPAGSTSIELPRVVQRVIRAGTEQDFPRLAPALRETALALLAATDPGEPDLPENDQAYEWSYPHLIEAGALKSDNPKVRWLVINQVRRLWLRGGRQEALSLGEAALEAWQFDLDNFERLAMAVEVAIVLRMVGRTKEAFELNGDTFRRLEPVRDEYCRTYLMCVNSYGEDLRLIGRYEDAIRNDCDLVTSYEQVFTPGSPRRLNLRNNIALDMRCLGQYEESLSYETEAAEQQGQDYEPTSQQWLSSLNGRSSSLRRLGRYQEALKLTAAAAEIVDAPGARTSFLWINILMGYSVSLRRVGRYPEARALAERVYDRCLAYAGEGHRTTLVVATNLMSDRRLNGDLAGAQDLGKKTVEAWDNVVGPAHPNALIAQANLAIILRMCQSVVAAREMNKRVLDGLGVVFPPKQQGQSTTVQGLPFPEHPYQLIVMTNMASDMAADGDPELARELGEKVVELSSAATHGAVKPSVTARGATHPATLAASANLALDMKATGDKAAGLALEVQTLAELDAQLLADHPQTLLAGQHGRLNLDIEPATP